VVAIGLWVKGTQEARVASIRLHNKLCSAFYTQMVRRRSILTLTEYMIVC
jgi:hypothetical protein